LSAYVLHTLPVYWPNAVPELLATLQPSNLPTIPPERTAWILLEILTVLPEEVRTLCIVSMEIYIHRSHLVSVRPVRAYCTLSGSDVAPKKNNTKGYQTSVVNTQL
jgi:hypothetical protein